MDYGVIELVAWALCRIVLRSDATESFWRTPGLAVECRLPPHVTCTGSVKDMRDYFRKTKEQLSCTVSEMEHAVHATLNSPAGVTATACYMRNEVFSTLSWNTSAFMPRVPFFQAARWFSFLVCRNFRSDLRMPSFRTLNRDEVGEDYVV